VSKKKGDKPKVKVELLEKLDPETEDDKPKPVVEADAHTPWDEEDDEGEDVEVTIFILKIAPPNGGPIDMVPVRSTETLEQVCARLNQASDRKIVYFPPLSDGFLTTRDDDGEESQITRHAYRSGAIFGVMEPGPVELEQMLSMGTEGWEDEDDGDSKPEVAAPARVQPADEAHASRPSALPAGFKV
jgi:hypothetical protein